MKVAKTVMDKAVKTVWGGSKFIVQYHVRTEERGACANEYEVLCELRGIDQGEPELEIAGVDALTNNEDTLTAEALAEVLGWQIGAYVKTNMKGGA